MLMGILHHRRGCLRFSRYFCVTDVMQQRRVFTIIRSSMSLCLSVSIRMLMATMTYIVLKVSLDTILRKVREACVVYLDLCCMINAHNAWSLHFGGAGVVMQCGVWCLGFSGVQAMRIGCLT